MIMRWIGAVVAFAVVAVIGLVVFGNFSTGIDPGSYFDSEGANSFALILAIAVIVAFAAYATSSTSRPAASRRSRASSTHAPSSSCPWRSRSTSSSARPSARR